MARDIREYDGIIGMARPVSKTHRPMPPENRAAQFAPYAALVGYEEMVDESAEKSAADGENITYERFDPSP